VPKQPLLQGDWVELRPELMPPPLDEAKVAHLAELAATIDGANPGQWEDELAEFNRGASTDLKFLDFQGIFGGQEHDCWVRKLLAESHQQRLPDITRAELIELARRVAEADGTEHEIDFWLDMLVLNIPDPQVSDLIFWPGEYFGDGDNSREFTPEQVIEIALSRAAGGKQDAVDQ
jgi:hypothetical protein